MAEKQVIWAAGFVLAGMMAQLYAFGGAGSLEGIVIAFVISGLPLIIALAIYTIGLPFHRKSPASWLTVDTASTIRNSCAILFVLVLIGAIGITLQ